MRLLNIETLELKWFNDKDCPQYAILSHTWGEGEVHFDIWNTPERGAPAAGHAKILGFCKAVGRYYPELKYGWVDACCIDKKSSAELSEAINSMYKWYEQAAVCIAYLSDVKDEPITSRFSNSLIDEICRSRWFSRGWTLQELIAPPSVVFVDSHWFVSGVLRENMHHTALQPEYITSFVQALAKRTSISRAVLDGTSKPLEWSVANRMSWASDRQTTRIEDEAYSLLGLFNVSIPLIYGEGKNAFVRLQEEIIRRSTDQSIFIHRLHESSGQKLFATSPADFGDFRGKEISLGRPNNSGNIASFEVTNVGLRIAVPIIPCGGLHGRYHVLLDCHLKDDQYGPLGLTVKTVNDDFTLFELVDHENHTLNCQTLHMPSYTVAVDWPDPVSKQQLTILRGAWTSSQEDRPAKTQEPLASHAQKRRCGVFVDIQRPNYGRLRSLYFMHYQFVGDWLSNNRLPAVWKIKHKPHENMPYPRESIPDIGAVAMTVQYVGRLAMCMSAEGANVANQLAIVDIGAGRLEDVISSRQLLAHLKTGFPQVWRFQDVELAVTMTLGLPESMLSGRLTVALRERGEHDLSTEVFDVPSFPFVGETASTIEQNPTIMPENQKLVEQRPMIDEENRTAVTENPTIVEENSMTVEESPNYVGEIPIIIADDDQEEPEYRRGDPTWLEPHVA